MRTPVISMQSILSKSLILISSILLLVSCSKPDMYDAEGQGLRFDDLNKKWLIVNYWATWCAPCKVISELFQTQKLIDSNGDSFVRISIDVSDGSDAVEEIQARFAATALPSLLVLDHKGVETARYTKMEATEAGLIAFLKSAKE